MGELFAKAKEYQNEVDADTLQKRMSGLKSDLLAAAFLKWQKEEDSKKNQKHEKSTKPESTSKEESKSHVKKAEKKEKPKEQKVPEKKQTFPQKESATQNPPKVHSSRNESITQQPPNTEVDYFDDLPDLTHI